jgi:hypothetical protein
MVPRVCSTATTVAAGLFKATTASNAILFKESYTQLVRIFQSTLGMNVFLTARAHMSSIFYGHATFIALPTKGRASWHDGGTIESSLKDRCVTDNDGLNSFVVSQKTPDHCSIKSRHALRFSTDTPCSLFDPLPSCPSDRV